MLRRDPTPITLRDTDVQELRAIMAQRAKAKETGSATDESVQPAEDATTSGAPFVHNEEAKKKREAMTKEQRL
ncbi:hypothetical protein FRB90_009381, partial [Tulasnella sp. 427]